MGYSKLCYVLFDLKKVVIFACFNVTIYSEFELLIYQLVYLINKIFIFIFFKTFGKFAYLWLVCARNYCFFSFSSIGFIVVSLHNFKT
jgi:hypothetical protein